MNWDIAAGNWKQFKLTGDRLDVISATVVVSMHSRVKQDF